MHKQGQLWSVAQWAWLEVLEGVVDGLCGVLGTFCLGSFKWIGRSSGLRKLAVAEKIQE